MDGHDIHDRIEQLVAEEHALWERESEGQVGDDERRRLRLLKIELDRCWDLLRQRRALGSAGLDPDGASARKADVVERYQQ
jgi:hypothetical protein